MENSGEKFKKLMENQGLGNLAKSDKEKFEALMKKERLDKISDPLKKNVFAAYYRLTPDSPLVVLEEFESKEAMDEWYEKYGREIENANGCQIELKQKLSESEEE